jgi:hypothetical protein
VGRRKQAKPTEMEHPTSLATKKWVAIPLAAVCGGGGGGLLRPPPAEAVNGYKALHTKHTGVNTT